MATDQPSELAQFHQFIGEQLNKQADLSPDEALVLWHETHLDDDPDDDSLIADVEEAIEEMKSGVPGIPADEFFKKFRESRGLS